LHSVINISLIRCIWT